MTISRRAALSLIALTLLPTLACKQAAEPAAPTPETASTAAARTELAPAHRAAGDGPAALPPGHPPIDGSAGVIAAPPLGGTTTGGQLVWTVPDSWTSEPPANAMRRAQYRVPGPGGDAELVVFYFGPGEGGDPRANAERWAGQFVQPIAAANELAFPLLRGPEVSERQPKIGAHAPNPIVGARRAGFDAGVCRAHLESSPACHRQRLRHHEHVLRHARNCLAIERDARIGPPRSGQDVGSHDIHGGPGGHSARTLASELRQSLGLG